MFAAHPISLTIIQILATLSALVGIYFYNFNWNDIAVILLFYFLYSGVGVSMMLHRYWTHKSFEFKFPFLKWIFTWFALMAGRGSILGWVHVHREHHAYADTEKDPHSPKFKKWKVFFPHLMNYGREIKRFLVRDLFTPTQLRINKYYMLLVFAWIVFLALIDLKLLIIAWAIPVAVTHLVLNSFTYFSHNSDEKVSRDYSVNSFIFGMLLWGEGWHNNHHVNPRNYSNSSKWWEIDVIGNLIGLIKK